MRPATGSQSSAATIPSSKPMKAPTSTLVRRLVGSVRTATAGAVMRLASMSLAERDGARRVEAVELQRHLALLGERDLGVEGRQRDELLDGTERRVGDDLLLLRTRGGKARVHEPELRVDVLELLFERVDLRLRVTAHLVHGLSGQVVRSGSRPRARGARDLDRQQRRRKGLPGGRASRKRSHGDLVAQPRRPQACGGSGASGSRPRS